ncbi:MAG: hypothetical protein HY585_02350 [Candidatus Omnitrophica bacterium]|nr:hypothetical protein [Candidatus Omnitrophota bacterium]
MICVLIAFLCFALYILSHVIAFRAGVIRFELTKLLFLMALWGSIYCLIAIYFVLGARGQSALPVSLFWSSLILYGLMSLLYFGEITSIQHLSPSMKIIVALSKKNTGEITPEEAKNLFSNQELIISRLDDLVAHGHIQYQGGSYTLGPKGKVVIGLVQFYRRLLGRTLGG